MVTQGDFAEPSTNSSNQDSQELGPLISPDHERGEILDTIPGTPQAEETLIVLQIPETAVVNRDEATVEVSCAGDPEFEPIEGTDLSYAVNTAFDIIKIAND